jgi:hypothetical protein
MRVWVIEARRVLAGAAALATAACGPSVSGVQATGTLNEGAQVLLGQIEANTITCGSARRFAFDAGHGPAYFEMEGLTFEVSDNQATAADIKNGKTFVGIVAFGEGSVARSFFWPKDVMGPPLEAKWTEWSGPYSEPNGGKPVTYKLIQSDGEWKLEGSGGLPTFRGPFFDAAEDLVNDGTGKYVDVDCGCVGPECGPGAGISSAVGTPSSTEWCMSVIEGKIQATQAELEANSDKCGTTMTQQMKDALRGIQLPGQ